MADLTFGPEVIGYRQAERAIAVGVFEKTAALDTVWVFYTIKLVA
jgi:hypothetical protein